MLKGKSFVRDLIVFLLLILTIKYAYQLMHKPDQTSATFIDFAQEQAEQVADAASKAYYQTSTGSKDPQRAHLSEKTRNLLVIADDLITQLYAARMHVDKDMIMTDRDKDDMKADIKAAISQIEHIIAEFEQDPANNQALLGPAGSSTRVVFERSLQHKLVETAQTAEIIFIRLYNELQGTHKPLAPAASLNVCLTNIKKLNSQLS